MAYFYWKPQWNVSQSYVSVLSLIITVNVINGGRQIYTEIDTNRVITEYWYAFECYRDMNRTCTSKAKSWKVRMWYTGTVLHGLVDRRVYHLQ
jgi:hypothetical protein